MRSIRRHRQKQRYRNDRIRVCFRLHRYPQRYVLDIVVHRSAVSGDDGIQALVWLVYTFLAKGGFAIRINVLDPSVLRRAQKDPEKYRNLQVSLCCLNVQFVNLKKNEQDEFIRWSEK